MQEIFDRFSRFDSETINQLVFHEHPWWVMVILILIPICSLLFLRELMCWFWKVNRVVTLLERIDRRLKKAELERGKLPGVPPIDAPVVVAEERPARIIVDESS